MKIRQLDVGENLAGPLEVLVQNITVEQLLGAIEAIDGSTQKYKVTDFYNTPLNSNEVLLDLVYKIVVTAEDGVSKVTYIVVTGAPD